MTTGGGVLTQTVGALPLRFMGAIVEPTIEELSSDELAARLLAEYGAVFCRWLMDSDLIEWLEAHPDAFDDDGGRWICDHMPPDVRAATRAHRRRRRTGA